MKIGNKKSKLLKELEVIESISSKILGKNETKIFIVPAKKEAMHLAAAYLQNEDVIIVNDKYKEVDLELLSVIVHESRHAYQYQVVSDIIQGNKTDNKEKWIKELNENAIPKNLSDEELRKYALRSIEIDANAYSELFLQTIYPKVKLNYPDWLRPAVDKRKKELSQELNFKILEDKFNENK